MTDVQLVPVPDRVAIEDLFARYAAALDGGTVEEIVGCFTDDAELVSPTVGTLVGTAGIREFAARFVGSRSGGTQLRHFISNIRVLSFDGDHAEATAYLLTVVTHRGASSMIPPGRYAVSLDRRDGTWLFRRRVVVHDAPFTIPGV